MTKRHTSCHKMEITNRKAGDKKKLYEKRIVSTEERVKNFPEL